MPDAEPAIFSSTAKADLVSGAITKAMPVPNKTNPVEKNIIISVSSGHSNQRHARSQTSGPKIIVARTDLVRPAASWPDRKVIKRIAGNNPNPASAASTAAACCRF